MDRTEWLDGWHICADCGIRYLGAMPGWFGRSLALGTLAAFLGCAPSRPATSSAAGGPGRVSRSGPGPGSSGVLLLQPGVARGWPEGDNWRLAATGQELDWSRLAGEEGATGLVEGVARGGEPALTALKALPFCDDAEVVVGRLCAWIPVARPAEPLLESLQRIAAKPYGFGESLDEAGLETCDAALGRAATSARLDAHERDLAASARAMFREWPHAH